MDLCKQYGLRRVINACGKMTALSSAIVLPEIREIVNESMKHFYLLSELQDLAGRTIANATDAEWGCVTACTSSGITLSVAACMTGKSIGRVLQLPDATGMPNRVIIQKGHCVDYGAPVTQNIRLAGAEVVEAGSVNKCRPEYIRYELEKGNVAAVLQVESHHTMRYGYVKLPELVEIAHEFDVPVIVDGAAQDQRMKELSAMGCDLLICSAHKYLCGTTAGIVAGRRDLVEAVDLQNRGIGRPMKAGKEAIFGAIAALEYRMTQDMDAWTAEQDRKVTLTLDLLKDIPGLELETEPDPNGCPFSRPKLTPDPEATGHTPHSLAEALREGDPTVVPRAHYADQGHICLDTIELTDEEIRFMCDKVRRILTGGNPA